MKIPVTIAEKNIQYIYEETEDLKPGALKMKEIKANIKNLKVNVVVFDLPDEWVGDGEDEENDELEKVRIKIIIEGILEKQIFWLGKRNKKTYQKRVSKPFLILALFNETDLDEFGSVFDGFKFNASKIQVQARDVNVEILATDLISPHQLLETIYFSYTLKLEQLIETSE